MFFALETSAKPKTIFVLFFVKSIDKMWFLCYNYSATNFNNCNHRVAFFMRRLRLTHFLFIMKENSRHSKPEYVASECCYTWQEDYGEIVIVLSPFKKRNGTAPFYRISVPFSIKRKDSWLF